MPDFTKWYLKEGEDHPQDQILKYSYLVPEEIRQPWIDMHKGWFAEIRTFLRHPDWKIHSKAKDNSVKMYTRISDKNFLCMKSVAFANESFEDLV